MNRPLVLLCVLGFTFCGTIAAQENLRPEQTEFFEKHIRPAFVKYCYECHSQESGKTRGGLLVDTRDGLMQGGDSGPALAPGSLAESVLWSAVNWEDYEMPPKQKMPADVIAHFKTWIEMGAPDPRVREKVVVESKIDIEAGKKHWAFQKPQRPTKTDIDSLVAAKLAAAKMTPVGATDPLTLLRRLSFDLVGLPPTPAEAREFYPAWRKDPQAAIEAKVDELLKRPQFGERWGRHWLDVARYAESSGKSVNVTFPHAWRYRDYVIDSFNADKPYDEFVREQIAGDLLPIESDEEWQENLIATGFLAMGTKGLNEQSPRQFRMDVVDEQIDTMSQAILGITVSCARCHDHKFDPIPTTDYYALAGIFLSTDTFYGTTAGLQNRRPTNALLLPLADKQHTLRSYSQDEIERMQERLSSLRSTMRQIRAESQRTGDRPEQRRMVALRNQMGQLSGLLATLTEDGAPKTFAMGVQDADRPVNANVLLRGNVEKPAQEVSRGFLQVLEDVRSANIKPRTSGRRELAEWLTSKDNPLTARVMVNRVWMNLFGNAMVASPNNWGVTGQKPTHPELLDYLATEFMENDWSVKSLIREIVLSQTYQRSSEFNEQNYIIDPDNQLLWRANPRQLNAEALRDSTLMVGGNLDLSRPLGSPVASAGDGRVGRTVNPEVVNQPSNHRSVYLPVVRDMLPESLELFDFADPSAANPRRDTTNVPSQALYLMNSEFVTEQAEAMALLLWKQFDKSDERVRWGFIQAYGRVPSEVELAAAAQFFRNFEPPKTQPASEPRRRPFRRPGQRLPDREPIRATQLTPDQHALAVFCQSLIASAEFRILN